MGIFDRYKSDPQPITATLNRAAAILGIAGASLGTGFLLQAQIIEEIARRIAALEPTDTMPAAPFENSPMRVCPTCGQDTD